MDRQNRDLFSPMTIILLLITSISGILSLSFSHSYEIVNQYGDSVSVYGYGIYAHDSYFKAPLSIGADITMLVCGIPMFLHTWLRYCKTNSSSDKLKLISLYATALYYSASICFGVTYNKLVLVYILLFACCLFGMFSHISTISVSKAVPLTKGLKAFLILSGIALFVAWLPDIIPTLLKDTTLPLIEVYTTEITYVLDMGIISPLCIATIYLLHHNKPLGALILACILKACIFVGIMMFPQTICQMLSGIVIPLPALLTKSASFILLGGFACYFNHRLYKGVETK